MSGAPYRYIVGGIYFIQLIRASAEALLFVWSMYKTAEYDIPYIYSTYLGKYEQWYVH